MSRCSSITKMAALIFQFLPNKICLHFDLLASRVHAWPVNSRMMHITEPKRKESFLKSLVFNFLPINSHFSTVKENLTVHFIDFKAIMGLQDANESISPFEYRIL